MREDKCLAKCKKMGIGDRVAWTLEKIGIRKRKGCGCVIRKFWMNEIDRKIYRLIRGPKDGTYTTSV